MLVLSRKSNEEIVIDGNIRVRILEVRGGRVRVGIEAPAEKSIRRAELAPREFSETMNLPRTAEAVAINPTAVNPTAVNPTAVNPTAMNPTAVQPTAAIRAGGGLHRRVSQRAESGAQRATTTRSTLSSGAPRGTEVAYTAAAANEGHGGTESGGLVREAALPVYRLADLACAG